MKVKVTRSNCQTSVTNRDIHWWCVWSWNVMQTLQLMECKIVSNW